MRPLYLKTRPVKQEVPKQNMQAEEDLVDLQCVLLQRVSANQTTEVRVRHGESEWDWQEPRGMEENRTWNPIR